MAKTSPRRLYALILLFRRPSTINPFLFSKKNHFDCFIQVATQINPFINIWVKNCYLYPDGQIVVQVYNHNVRKHEQLITSTLQYTLSWIPLESLWAAWPVTESASLYSSNLSWNPTQLTVKNHGRYKRKSFMKCFYITHPITATPFCCRGWIVSSIRTSICNSRALKGIAMTLRTWNRMIHHTELIPKLCPPHLSTCNKKTYSCAFLLTKSNLYFLQVITHKLLGFML